MKYSFMSFSCPALNLGDMLALAKRLGYDGIEPRIDCGHAHGVEIAAGAPSRQAACQAAQRQGVAICCVATSCVFADPATAPKMIETANAAIDLAADVGAPCIRVFGGALGAGLSRPQAVEQVARSLASLADHAAQRGVTVCMETHDAWCSPADVAAVMSAVNHAAVGVNWDIMHPVLTAGVSIDDSYRTLAPWVRHMHVHDGYRDGGQLVMTPMGTGHVDHARAIALVHDGAYGGFLSGEWINWEPYETHLPRELAAMKKFETAKK